MDEEETSPLEEAAPLADEAPQEETPAPAETPAPGWTATTSGAAGTSTTASGTDGALPYPVAGQAALLYSGSEPLSRDGLTFAPDSLQIVDEETAAKLAGCDNIRRVVVLDAHDWANYLAMRARAQARRSA